jgi:hypothetical protein
MHVFAPPAFTTSAVRIIAAALALLVALHGSVAAALSARGPLHTHAVARAATIVVLDDVRRGPTHAGSAIDPAVLRHGHSHGASAALRHHHSLGDASVVLDDGEAALHASDGDDAGGGATLAALVALLPSVVVWLPHGARDTAASRLAWVPRLHQPEPFERPPRSV